MSVIDTIEIGATEVLGIIDSVLPIVEKALPVVAASAGPVGLGVSAAAALLPLLQKIPVGPTFTVDTQQQYLQRIQAMSLLDFSGAAWQPSTQSAGAPAVPAGSLPTAVAPPVAPPQPS